MNHQPFEEWLLDDKNLNPAEKRELDLHLRTCSRCTSLAEVGLALRSAPVVPPAAGFTLRFQQRLAVQKVAERRRKLWGMIVLLAGGAGLLGWILAPFLLAFLAAPVEWVTAGIGYFLFILTSLQALTEVVAVLFRMATDFIPPYVWMVIVSALAGLGLLWTISIWQFSRTPQGVTV
ncbi:MAG: zf-HC2 domain-containing protein [Chloroflexi bacterium]|nr:zf-HC2 domain-containing protein [Chloroflexota bacterium]